MIDKIIDSIKFVKPKDICAPLLLLLAIVPSLIYRFYTKISDKPLWLICENGKSARDNGYYFYKYLVENHPEINCRYAIRKESADYEKINKLGRRPVQAFGFKHYILYLSAKWNISNYKSGNPNPILFYIIHIYLKLINNRVFLQHGVIKDDLPFIHYENARFKYFVTSTKREYEYVKNKFGYPDGSIILTGLPRFDTLIDASKTKKQILIMPTWRSWITRGANRFQKQKAFKKTNYYKKWSELINSTELNKWLTNNDYKAIFYPHINMEEYLGSFKVTNKRIKIVDSKTDIQTMLKESSILITDYSSVYMDFAYMTKPVIYYHFDYDEYRRKHLPEGYFDYGKDGFGPIISKSDQLPMAFNLINKNRLKYIARCKDFFTLKDDKNCERVFTTLYSGDKTTTNKKTKANESE